jgi:hypothetical protein
VRTDLGAEQEETNHHADPTHHHCSHPIAR